MPPGAIVIDCAPDPSSQTVAVSCIRTVSVAISHVPRARLIVPVPLVRRCRGGIRATKRGTSIAPPRLDPGAGLCIVGWATALPGPRRPSTPCPRCSPFARCHDNDICLTYIRMASDNGLKRLTQKGRWKEAGRKQVGVVVDLAGRVKSRTPPWVAPSSFMSGFQND